MTAGLLLEVEGLTVDFDGFKALNGLDFSLMPGELHFVIGSNGAGKTTLLDVLCGRVRPSAGRVRFAGRDLARLAEHEIVRLGVGRKFQTPSVFPSLTVWENLELAAWYRRPFGLSRAAARAVAARVEATLPDVGLASRARAPAGHLSHGEKQWLEIAMLLVQDPSLLLLDEPVAGMTREERARTGEILRRVARDRTVLVVEHDMGFVRRFAHSVTVLHEGRVLARGAVDEVQRDPRVVDVYLGRRHGEARGEPLDRAAAR